MTFGDWRLKMENLFSTFAPKTALELVRCELHQVPCELAPGGQAEAAAVFKVLCDSTVKEALGLFKNDPSKNGFEARRLLTLRYDPRTDLHLHHLYKRILNAPSIKSVKQFRADLPKWEDLP